MDSTGDDLSTSLPDPQPRRPTSLTRRRLLQATTASTVVAAVAGAWSQAKPASKPTAAGTSRTLEVVTTNSPLRDYAGRSTGERALFDLDRVDEWQAAGLAGEKPEHLFGVRLLETSSAIDVDAMFYLHVQTARTVRLRLRGDLRPDRLWVSKDYLHVDRGRALFPDGDAPDLFTDRLWFATIADDSPDPDTLIEPSYTYQQADGFLGLPLSAGYRYEFEWQTHADGISRDYRTAWLRDGEILAELTESVYPANGRGSILPLPISLYLDAPEFACCTAKADEWACC